MSFTVRRLEDQHHGWVVEASGEPVLVLKTEEQARELAEALQAALPATQREDN